MSLASRIPIFQSIPFGFAFVLMLLVILLRSQPKQLASRWLWAWVSEPVLQVEVQVLWEVCKPEAFFGLQNMPLAWACHSPRQYFIVTE